MKDDLPDLERAFRWKRFLVSLMALVVVGLAGYQIGFSQNVYDVASTRPYFDFVAIRLAPAVGVAAILAHVLKSRWFFVAACHGVLVGPIIHWLHEYIGLFQVYMRVSWRRGTNVLLSEATAVSVAFQGLALVAVIVVFGQWLHGKALKAASSEVQFDRYSNFVSANLTLAGMWLASSVLGLLGFYIWLAVVFI